MRSKKKIAIIGGGISGLSCALNLDISRFDVSIFDKGRKPGGRLATRRYDDFHFDHGAQYITPTDSLFNLELQEWKKDGVVDLWNGVIGELNGEIFEKTFSNHHVYVGTPKMSSIPKYLAGKLKSANFHRGTKIVKIYKKFNHWFLRDQNGDDHGSFDFIVITLPPHQAIELVKEYPYLVEILEEIISTPRWAVMMGFDRKVPVQFDAAFVNSDEETSERPIIRWLVRNNSKPGRPSNESWLIHTHKNWSLEHLEEDPKWIADQVVEEMRKITKDPTISPVFSQAHRWRYGIVENSLEQNFVLDNNRNIGMCGDYFYGRNIESAYISGETLGNRLNQLKI